MSQHSASQSLRDGGLHVVTPSARTRPAKVDALAAFFVRHLSDPGWRSGA